MDLIHLDNLCDSLQARPGVVVGDGITTIPGQFRDILEKVLLEIGEHVEHSGGKTLGELADAAKILSENHYDSVKNIVVDELKNGTSPHELRHITQISWSLCISFTMDLRFETELKTYLDSLPLSSGATIVSDDAITLPARTLPVYKLYGNYNHADQNSTIAIADSDILIRQQIWSRMLKTCSDYLRQAPLIFLGTDNNQHEIQEILTSLLSIGPPAPSRLIFLKSDPSYKNDTIANLLRRFRVSICDASIQEVATSVSDFKPKQMTMNLGALDTNSDDLSDSLQSYKQIASVVPNRLAFTMDFEQHRNALLDSLFRPMSMDWSPYLLQISFERSLTNVLVDKITNILETAKDSANDFLFLHGEAGVGKTTLLKQVAVELVTLDISVIWIRRRAVGISNKRYRDLAYDLNQYFEKNGNKARKVVLICDDPAGLNTDPSDLMDCFSRYSIGVVYLFSARNTDYLAANSTHESLSPSPDRDYEVNYTLDESELAKLPGWLVKIGVSEDQKNADLQVQQIKTKHASDILCSLWYLLPDTQSTISSSLQDEYVRLGEIENTVQSMAAGGARGSDVARKAYEVVTVVTHLGFGIPIEVLVRYLKVDYSEWLEMVGAGKPMWGLLYDEIDEEGTTTHFRTRNPIVTKVLLDLVNGGTAGNSGERRIITDVIRACDGGSPVYREFMLTVLIKANQSLRNIFTVESGLELFEIARKVNSHPDRVLEHHKGLWMQQNRKGLTDAYNQLKFALDCPEFPGSDRAAPKEHVQTSLAATVRMKMEEGEQSRETGLETIEQHLHLASSDKFFNSHTQHLAADLYYKLSLEGDSSDPLNQMCLSKSLTIIEGLLRNLWVKQCEIAGLQIELPV